MMSESGIRPFTDPALKTKCAILRLAARMALGGMIRLVLTQGGTIAPFTVVRRVDDNEDGTQTVTPLRLVLDERLETLRWVDPPWVPMSSPSAFGYLEVSTENPEGQPSEKSYRFRAATADIPDYFYRLDAGAELAECFCLRLSRAIDLQRSMKRTLGADLPEFKEESAQDYVAVSVLLMGW